MMFIMKVTDEGRGNGAYSLMMAHIHAPSAPEGGGSASSYRVLQPVPKMGQTAMQYAAGLLTVREQRLPKVQTGRPLFQTGCSKKSLKKLLGPSRLPRAVPAQCRDLGHDI